MQHTEQPAAVWTQGRFRSIFRMLELGGKKYIRVFYTSAPSYYISFCGTPSAAGNGHSLYTAQTRMTNAEAAAVHLGPALSPGPLGRYGPQIIRCGAGAIITVLVRDLAVGVATRSWKNTLAHGVVGDPRDAQPGSGIRLCLQNGQLKGGCGTGGVAALVAGMHLPSVQSKTLAGWCRARMRWTLEFIWNLTAIQSSIGVAIVRSFSNEQADATAESRYCIYGHLPRVDESRANPGRRESALESSRERW
ncbi:hypothetical protein C8R45DRAFT_922650 [Mycena sanguinolenta]|nr:hypothetical protein C8R45DRAFT_922650 [Mycena sanguinolenta]